MESGRSPQSKHWNVRKPLPPGGSARIKKAPQRGQVGRLAWPIAIFYEWCFIIICSVPDSKTHQYFSRRLEHFRTGARALPDTAKRTFLRAGGAVQPARLTLRRPPAIERHLFEQAAMFISRCLLCSALRTLVGHRAISEKCRHKRKSPLHSITSSARVSNVAGMTRSSVLAVLRLTANSNLIGCSIGRSLAFVPFKILAMRSPIHVRSMTNRTGSSGSFQKGRTSNVGGRRPKG
jgi:hypothetical protein